ncbi:MAG: 50S ribosomal protein L23 [Paludibacteraceae bacterium]|nr:50S ribosomal protein L23 [Candidatus Colicola caccequi]MBQ0154384.1 50S ribosomal protein L23 [Candidatus Colicola equi]MCQ2328015.1 50S ribosomal protein L23 [Paludibacteraceae bacterium]MCQ2339484.1 50S ribosomal protein L23 [Paludibacteraceae bacterium]
MAIIIKPIVTEKMTAAGEKLNRYGFQVIRTANKVEIKKAVEEMYNVQVVDVNTLIQGPKAQQRYTKSGLIRGEKQAYKKAIVTLKEGETIDFYSNI